MTMHLDPAIASLLSIDQTSCTISPLGGGCSSASTYKIVHQGGDGSSSTYFLKTGRGSDAGHMFAGEHEGLLALATAVPGICPKPLGHGRFKDDPNQSFLVTQYLDMSNARRQKNTSSLAAKLARLHTTPAPVPAGYDKQQFGFPMPTCCGETRQDNEFTSSWGDFYANRRLRFIIKQSRQRNGIDSELEHHVEQICEEVVPRLIGDNHLNNGHGIQAVVVHGDLWSGNAGSGRLPGMNDPDDVIYDPSSCNAHSEYELGIMNMFGGFGRDFMQEYHKLCPKMEPVEEYEDRVVLYELYHHLNHYAMFGGGYRGGAMRIMRGLVDKFGTT